MSQPLISWPRSYRQTVTPDGNVDKASFFHLLYQAESAKLCAEVLAVVLTIAGDGEECGLARCRLRQGSAVLDEDLRRHVFRARHISPWMLVFVRPRFKCYSRGDICVLRWCEIPQHSLQVGSEALG